MGSGDAVKPDKRRAAWAPFAGPLPTKAPPPRPSPWTRPLTDRDRPESALDKRKPARPVNDVRP